MRNFMRKKTRLIIINETYFPIRKIFVTLKKYIPLDNGLFIFFILKLFVVQLYLLYITTLRILLFRIIFIYYNL